MGEEVNVARISHWHRAQCQSVPRAVWLFMTEDHFRTVRILMRVLSFSDFVYFCLHSCGPQFPPLFYHLSTSHDWVMKNGERLHIGLCLGLPIYENFPWKPFTTVNHVKEAKHDDSRDLKETISSFFCFYHTVHCFSTSIHLLKHCALASLPQAPLPKNTVCSEWAAPTGLSRHRPTHLLISSADVFATKEWLYTIPGVCCPQMVGVNEGCCVGSFSKQQRNWYALLIPSTFVLLKSVLNYSRPQVYLALFKSIPIQPLGGHYANLLHSDAYK